MASNDKKLLWLIGELTPHLPEGFPTNREILRVYFHHRLVSLQQKGPSVTHVAKQIIAHWINLNEVTKVEQDVVRQLKKLIDKCDSYKKSMHRDTTTQRRNELSFIQLLNECFHIARNPNYHHNKNSKPEPVPEPRSKPKVVNCETEPRIDSNSNIDMSAEVIASDSNDDQNSDKDFETTLSSYQKSKFGIESKPEKGVIYKIVNSPEVSSVLDRTNTSNPTFTLLCAAIAGVVKEDLNQCVLSTSTIRRRRIDHRDRIVTIIKNEFSSTITSGLVVHWDGKKLKDTTNNDLTLRNKLVERMAVVVTGLDVEKIITISKTKDGTGLVMADTVYDHLLDWDILDRIVAICTDTTAANTGYINGSVILFQKHMKRNILYFACRHHVLELIIGAIFILLFGESTGPSPTLFENFRRDWHLIDQKSFQPFDEKIFKGNSHAMALRKDVITYIGNILSSEEKKNILKGDYLELLELCLIVLGVPNPSYSFHVMHACSHSRWMAKNIYSMKLFLFRRQLVLSKAEISNLQEICLFICLIYVKPWIQCCIPSNAPHNDLELYKELTRYSEINEEVSERAIAKLTDHLWYLGSEVVVLSLFSNKVTDVVKRRMFEKMKSLDNGKWVQRSWCLTDTTNIIGKDLDDFVNSSSMTALKSLKVDIQYMFDNDVSDWVNLDSYKTAKKIIDSLRVVNDTAERSLKLMTDINASFTSNEEEKQRSIQTIEDNRKRIPSMKKSVLSTYKKRCLE